MEPGCIISSEPTLGGCSGVAKSAKGAGHENGAGHGNGAQHGNGARHGNRADHENREQLRASTAKGPVA